MTRLQTLFAGGLLALGAAAPASAVVNVLDNGSFEAGALGKDAVPGWTKTNTPDGSAGKGDTRASVIGYNGDKVPYPNGAFNEAVTPDNSVSLSPDAVGNKAAYFVGDQSVDETWSQLTYLGVGNYRIGFSYYLTNNGLKNEFNATLKGTIIGVPVAMTMITNASPGKTWFNVSGVGQITKTGHYLTSLVYNSTGYPAKDIVVDRVYALRTFDKPDVVIPATPTIVPEPESWAMMILGFGLIGMSARRRKASAVAA